MSASLRYRPNYCMTSIRRFVPEAVICDYMKPGLRGKYWRQLPKSHVDMNNMGIVIRIPWFTAMPVASLVPVRNADIWEDPLSTANFNAVLNPASMALGCVTASGPI